MDGRAENGRNVEVKASAGPPLTREQRVGATVAPAFLTSSGNGTVSMAWRTRDTEYDHSSQRNDEYAYLCIVKSLKR